MEDDNINVNATIICFGMVDSLKNKYLKNSPKYALFIDETENLCSEIYRNILEDDNKEKVCRYVRSNFLLPFIVEIANNNFEQAMNKYKYFLNVLMIYYELENKYKILIK